MTAAVLDKTINEQIVEAKCAKDENQSFGSCGSSFESSETIQIVGFRLAEEEYGIEITTVQEIILLSETTRIPQASGDLLGLINLRSTVIPVIDLRRRFHLKEDAATDETRIIVVNVDGKTMGIVVDAVNEVLRVPSESISEAPPTVSGLNEIYLSGLVNLKDGLLILLNIQKILSEEV